MSKNDRRSIAAARQRGLSLVTTMVLMMATLGLGVAVMSVNAMEERMIANTKDRDLALQAAEAALRDAEQDVASNVSPATSFNDTCTSGLCTPPSQRDNLGALASLPVDDSRLGFDWTVDANVRRYGQFTGAADFPSVAAQPRYVIEKFSFLGTPAGESVVLGSEPTAPGVGYRITARGVGARPETVVVLQSIYATR
jgi:type IV pilus assembly protein PilX